MSLEDIHSQYPFEDSEDLNEDMSPDDSESIDEPDDIDPIDLFKNLTCFDNIYVNNIYMDLELEREERDFSSSSSDESIGNLEDSTIFLSVISYFDTLTDMLVILGTNGTQQVFPEDFFFSSSTSSSVSSSSGTSDEDGGRQAEDAAQGLLSNCTE